MWSRREFLARTGNIALSGALLKFGPDPAASESDLGFLRGLARDTIRSATKPGKFGSSKVDIVTPGGNYPSLWVRDFSMAVGSGLVPNSVILGHLRWIAQSQNGPEARRLQSGAIIPSFAIPDHITLDGHPVFYPGTYSPGEDQGGEPFGALPPVDDHYEFVHLAHVLHKRSGDVKFLGEEIAGMPIFDRLKKALECPRTDPETGLVVTEAGMRAVGFGFCDAVTLTGSLLFASLLRYRALGEMIELAKSSRRAATVSKWQKDRLLIRESVVKTFAQDGWLLAATGIGRQPDVWGTAYATYLGVLSGRAREAAAKMVAKAYRAGHITYCGAVRHIPTTHDFSATTAWEKTAGLPLNRYQNGAYWHVATGWLAACLAESDPSLAKRLVREAVGHFREEDFRLGSGKGSPWECIHPDGGYRQNAVYMASITTLLEVLSSREDLRT